MLPAVSSSSSPSVCFSHETPKWILLAASVGLVAGVVLLALAIAKISGPLGSIGFIATATGGGFLILTSLSGLIWSCVQPRDPPPEVRTEAPVADKPSIHPLASLTFHLGEQTVESMLEFAQLRPNPNPEPFPDSVTQYPIDSRIVGLMDRFYSAERTFEEHMQKSNPWLNPLVQESANHLIKLGYALGVLMIRDLPKLKEHFKASSFKALLDDPRCYAYHVYNLCPIYYRQLRYRMGSETDTIPATPMPEYDRQFYEKGSSHELLRSLYNAYSKLLQETVPDIEPFPQDIEVVRNEILFSPLFTRKKR